MNQVTNKMQATVNRRNKKEVLDKKRGKRGAVTVEATKNTTNCNKKIDTDNQV